MVRAIYLPCAAGTNRPRRRLFLWAREQCRTVRRLETMTFGYAQPFSFQIGAPQVVPQVVTIAGVRHGVTEITLSDGRLIRATLHVKNVRPSSQKPGSLDISYNIVTEVMAVPDVPIMDVHETVQ